MLDEDSATRLEAIATSDNLGQPSTAEHSSPQRHSYPIRTALQHQSATVDGVLSRLRTDIANFWRRQIALVTGQSACRDHFANERTFLGYLRTASAVALLGVAGCQLFLLDSQNAKCKIQYARILAYTCHATAILIVLCGAYRFWRHQNAMARGKTQAGGWEVNVTGIIGLGVTILALILVLLDDEC